MTAWIYLFVGALFEVGFTSALRWVSDGGGWRAQIAFFACVIPNMHRSPIVAGLRSPGLGVGREAARLPMIRRPVAGRALYPVLLTIDGGGAVTGAWRGQLQAGSEQPAGGAEEQPWSGKTDDRAIRTRRTLSSPVHRSSGGAGGSRRKSRWQGWCRQARCGAALT
jgi:hypothetical protein